MRGALLSMPLKKMMGLQYDFLNSHSETHTQMAKLLQYEVIIAMAFIIRTKPIKIPCPCISKPERLRAK